MQGSKNSFFDKKAKQSHRFDDGVSKHHGSFKKKDYHHIARNKGNKQDLSNPL